jgi:hypothetical protein
MENLIFEIQNITRTSDENVVHTVYWTATLEQDGVKASIENQTILPYKKSNNPTFVPFDSLTKEKIYEWLMNHIDKSFVFDSLEKAIEARKSPAYIYGLPTT